MSLSVNRDLRTWIQEQAVRLAAQDRLRARKPGSSVYRIVERINVRGAALDAFPQDEMDYRFAERVANDVMELVLILQENKEVA